MNEIDCCKTNLEILVSKLYKHSKDLNNDNNSNDNNDSNNNNNSDSNNDNDSNDSSNNNDYGDSVAVAAAIAYLLSLLPH